MPGELTFAQAPASADGGVEGGSAYAAEATAPSPPDAGVEADAPSNVEADAPSNPTPIAYAGHIASATATKEPSLLLSVGDAGVAMGDAILVAVLLSSTSPGDVTATDSAGNVYAVLADATDGAAADRLTLLGSLNSSALASGSTIVLSFPDTTSVIASADAFSGIHAPSGTATGGAPNSTQIAAGPLTRATPGLVVGVVAVESGGWTWTAAPWQPLPDVTASDDVLSIAYGVGESFAIAGTSTGSAWMAIAASFD
jgi:hypothetical protein